MTAAAVCAAAASGAAIATAASGTSSSSSTSATAADHGRHQDDRGRHTFDGRTEEPLSGDVASKVRAAALAKVSGTVERAESNVDSSAPYEAHIVRSEGTEADVRVSKDFKVTAVNDMGGHHR